MPAKTSNGRHRYAPQERSNVVVAEEGLNASGGAILEAERRLGVTTPTRVLFFKTGERRSIVNGDLYVLGVENVYVATGNGGDEFDIVDVKVVP